MTKVILVGMVGMVGMDPRTIASGAEITRPAYAVPLLEELREKLGIAEIKQQEVRKSRKEYQSSNNRRPAFQEYQRRMNR